MTKVNTILIATSITLSIASMTIGLLIGLYPMVSSTVINNKNNLKDIIRPIYSKSLTVNSDGIDGATNVMKQLFYDDFRSIDVAQTKNKDAMIASVLFFWQLVPNLKWVPQEILQVGDNNW